MPLLPTSHAYLEQSALLLQAYPDTTRITTKYNFPSTRPSNTSRKQKSKPTSTSSPATTTETTPQTPTTPLAYLTLKTYNPTTGICLKYRTNKAAEVGRLITSLGKLAAGASVAELGLSNPVPAAPAAADVEMADAPEDATSGGASTPVVPAAPAKGDAGGKGGKGKKKGGKGRR
ncbi:SRP9/SRP21 family protein [Aspergillus candidus]|uniref:Signal recognition particle 9 kDa protein-domain-containing protein n=1 Tax=Aspergillus candidus TaxID=41067 RepID=A0A2I2FBX3_ASPCN|nr:signal recognition particle 9 kDa protein-domain-containing protein [Aspergillus candidus]PLB38121.1 signal recognition particle 9 kDa protein-domain-containing protein [Aspergillus candidus]